MRLGTKSLLFGAHCIIIHPFFVAAAWFKLFGPTWNIRDWLCFFLHDIGYWGCPNMDGPEGENHPLVGALWVAAICHEWLGDSGSKSRAWMDHCLFHSRYYAQKMDTDVSKLCIADKLAVAITPTWLYVPMVMVTGEVWEYMNTAKSEEHNPWVWHGYLRSYMLRQVKALQADPSRIFDREELNKECRIAGK